MLFRMRPVSTFLWFARFNVAWIVASVGCGGDIRGLSSDEGNMGGQGGAVSGGGGQGAGAGGSSDGGEGGDGGGMTGGDAGAQGGTGGATEPQQLMPLEVIGPAGYSQTAVLPLSGTGTPRHLFMRTHRAAFKDASVNPMRGAKASVRLNGGPWIPLTNEHVTCAPHEAAYGCLNGAYHTVRFELPIQTLGAPGPVSGENQIEFRFNATDGQTSGFRVLELNFIDDAGARMVPDRAFAEDNPDAWTAPLDTPEDIEAGRMLFASRTLVKSPLEPNTRMLASCADCHAQDGRDLAYFNYSNWSIEARSLFHGMSERESQQVSSYIRAVGKKLAADENVRLSALGRPWNPPYQPGVDMDDRPVVAWAAGAGVDAVVDDDIETLAMLSGGDKDATALRKALGPDGDVNQRTLPLAIQLPDWNDWLPDTHPLDVWGAAFENNDYSMLTIEPFAKYEQTRAELEMGETEKAIRTLDLFMGRTHSFVGGRLIDRDDIQQMYGDKLAFQTEGTDVVVYLDNETRRVDKEVATRALRHWSSVKQWEIMHSYGLEEMGKQLHGDSAESRSWLIGARSVFELAPHRAAHDNKAFAFQSPLVGKYFSTAWYELQVVLNGGRGFAEATLAPVDWNYQPNHIADLRSYGGPAHPVRLAATIGEMLQRFAHQDPSTDQWGFRQMHPVRWAPGTGQGNLFEQLPEAERRALLTALVAATMDLFERYLESAWARTANGAQTGDESYRLEPASYRPQRVTDMGLNAAHDVQRYADCWLTMIPLFKDAGVETREIERLKAWGKMMWPLGDWDAL